MIAMYVPRTTPVAKISFSFHESGIGDGFTLSLEMVMMVPSFKMAIIKTMKGEKSKLPYQSYKQETQHDSDCDGNCIDCVVFHPLKDGPTC